MTEQLFVPADPCGKNFNCNAKMSDLRTQPRECSGVVTTCPVVIDDSTKHPITIKTCSTDASTLCHDREANGFAVAVHLRTHSFDFGECLCGGHLASPSVKSASSRATRR